AMGLVGAAPKFLHRLAKQARKPLMTPAYLAAVNSYALASSKLQGVGAIVARSAFLMYETLGKTLPNPMLAYIWLLTLGYATTRRDQVIRALPEAKAMLNPFALTEYLFAKILANPQGVLLGHYEIEHNFEYYSKHQDGKIRLYFADYAQDLSRLIAQDVEPDEKEYPFVLNGGLRTGFTANTIMRDPSWRKGRAIHASLYMSEADAAALNAKEGDLVKISSKRSSVIAPVKVDKNTLTGHLHLPNILGQYYPDPVTGELKANGIAINELVDLTDRDPYTGCPHTKRIRCKVELVN
ncbi:MAG TPA: molybdopterin dinucleotide binding domain-containing protein, partial [Agitococcus sp.]|nr:molybdopterin dinucleotide binding domain-containing protein [Agitococcus sp.]